MNESSFDMNEFMKQDEQPEDSVVETVDEKESEETPATELQVQKEVVAALAADKAEMHSHIDSLTSGLETTKAKLEEAETELEKAKAELVDAVARIEEKERTIECLRQQLALKDSELAARIEKEFDLQERNPNALALLDREIEMPDRFPGETRDHVLEVIKEARDAAETEGRIRRAQLLESVLVANEPNGTLSRKREEVEKLFADNANILSGIVLEELKKFGISHKNGEDYLLPQEIIKRNF